MGGLRKARFCQLFLLERRLSDEKSPEGLLRPLLYQVLKECPALIGTALPSWWETDHSGTPLWSVQDLSDAFDRIAAQVLLPAKFCFFIDGLDEYEGEYIDIVRMLESLASSSSVKLCVSSRPWNVFVESFGANVDRKLLLQDFTRDDVKKYVKDVLGGDSRFRRLEDKDDRCKDLIQEIVDIAQGVFLWVFLVVRL
jgi:hypothetical protein